MFNVKRITKKKGCIMFKLACIGLDTSHSIAFTELIQGENKIVDGLHVETCMRFPSAFQSEPDQDGRQQKMEAMGVRVTKSFEEAVSGVDGILVEINDPALHLEYFTKAAELGKPVFLDKPVADTLENALKIHQIAKEKNIPMWSSSSLRFTPEIIACSEKIQNPVLCNVFGALGTARKGSSIVWYGVHAFEMLVTLMGRGAKSLVAREDETGVVATVNYGEGRRGVVECNKGFSRYGGRAQNKEAVEQFIAVGSPYNSLIKALRDFFLDKTIPVPFEESLDVQAMLNAAEKSAAAGGADTAIEVPAL